MQTWRPLASSVHRRGPSYPAAAIDPLSAQLPLPLAQVHIRARHAKSFVENHHCAFYAGEAAIKLAVVARVAVWLQDPEEGAVMRSVAKLERASLGQWVGLLRQLDGHLESADGLPIGGSLRRKVGPAMVALANAAEAKEVVSKQISKGARSRVGGALDLWVAYRNEILGHGAWREDAFYGELGPLLLAAVEELLAVEGLGTGFRWESVDGAGNRVALHGLEPQPLTSGGTPGIRLVHAAGELSIPPLVRMHGDRLGFLNRVNRRSGKVRRAEWLDYATGEAFSVAAPEALEAFLDAVKTEEPAPEAPEPADPFERIEELGRGGMGVVWLARQLPLGRKVALKELAPDLLSDDIARKRFAREIQVLATSDHPNIVRVLTSGERAGAPWYAMEYVEGSDLSEVANELIGARLKGNTVSLGVRPESSGGSTVPVQQGFFGHAALLFAGAARGLQHLHDAGVVHRDVKPANLVLTRSASRLVIMDLGLAQVRDASVALTTDQSGILGTLRYMPPEQLEGSTVEGTADLYALGACLYEILAGRPIHTGSTREALVQQVLTVDPPDLSVVDPGIPRDLAVIVAKATRKVAADRYRSAQLLAEDLEAFANGEPIRARPPTPVQRIRAFARRRPALSGAVAAVASLGLIVGLYGWETTRTKVSHYDRIALLGATVQPGMALSGDDIARSGRELQIERVGGKIQRVSWRPGLGLDDNAFEEWGDPDDNQIPASQIQLSYGDDGRLSRADWQTVRGHSVAIGDVEWTADHTYVVRWRNPIGHPIGSPASGALVERTTLDDHGLVTEIRNLGLDGEPASVEMHGYGRRFVRKDGVSETQMLDAAGEAAPGDFGIALIRDRQQDQTLSRSWFGMHDAPVNGTLGAHEIRFTVDRAGNILREDYLDAEGDPAYRTPKGSRRKPHSSEHDGHVLSVHGCSSKRFTWEGNRRAREECLDEDGDRRNATLGAAELRRTFDAGGCPTETSWHGVDGEPTVVLGNTAGFRTACGPDGQLVDIQWIEPTGDPRRGPLGYAQRTYSLDHSGRVIGWKKYDPAGEPVPAVAEGRYTRDDRGLITEVRLYDGDGRPARDDRGVAGWDRTFNEVGVPTQTQYVDPAGDPVTPLGSAPVVRNVRSATGGVTRTSLWGADGRPWALKGGYHRAELALDGQGNQVVKEYFGIDGDPVIHKGFHRYEADYNSQSLRLRERFFGVNGEPIHGPEGSHETRFVFDDQGKPVGTAWFGTDGQPVKSSTHHAHQMVNTYDKNGHLKTDRSLDGAGQPMRGRGGIGGRDVISQPDGALSEIHFVGPDGGPAEMYGVWRSEIHRNERGQLVGMSRFDKNNQPSPMGRLKWSFDDRGRVAEAWHETPDGEPEEMFGFYKTVYRYDERDRNVEVTNLNKSGEIAMGSHLFPPTTEHVGKRPRVREIVAKVVFEWDERDLEISRSYFDASGPVDNVSGTHRMVKDYDEIGNLIGSRDFGRDGQPLERGGIHGWKRTLDRAHREVRREWFDGGGQPVPNALGVPIIDRAYDERGFMVAKFALDADRRPTATNQGWARIEYGRDATGNAQLESRLDTAHQPVAAPDGSYAWRRIFDGAGNVLEFWFLGPEGEPDPADRGFAGMRLVLHYTYEINGIDYLDVDGAPALHPAGFSSTLRRAEHSIPTQTFAGPQGESVAPYGVASLVIAGANKHVCLGVDSVPRACGKAEDLAVKRLLKTVPPAP